MSEVNSGWFMCPDYESHYFSTDRVAPCGELIALDATFEIPGDSVLVPLESAVRVCRRCLKLLYRQERNQKSRPG